MRAVRLTRHPDSDKAGYLFGVGEIAFRRLGQRSAFQRNDALIAFARYRLIEGDRQIALAEEGSTGSSASFSGS
jgi:hypothetical protein